MKKPDEAGFLRWLCAGWNLRTLVLAVIAVVGSHFAQSTRITLVEAQEPITKQRLDLQMQKISDLQKETIDRTTYEADQRRLSEQLKAIQDSTGRIESVLMEQHARGQ